MSEQEQSTAAPKKRFEPWPWVIVGILATALVVNATFIYLAGKSSNGLVIEGAYRRGITYNKEIDAARRQMELGWRVSLAGSEALQEGRQGAISLTVLDKSGQPVAGATVAGTLFRPTDQALDQPISMSEAAPGVYQAQITPAQRGIWDVKLKAQRGEDVYRFVQRISVKKAQPGE
ncbi:FixH family protein [Magnetofaba australis]|uniref:FixH family protein n=1 Tax=Magnetofaba australis IT-1 TaxID=1434232 RepID=A0A1Y2K3P4_9PROT|nr:FixH family protein [Magnetofaba australis]OSM02559.1 hypothetical protein MAIT1_02727 [Magnetofaba australis IT-1]